MTLQQEIVEALRIGATRCEDLRGSWESEYTAAHLDDEADKLRQLSDLVENARCETCKKYFMATSKDMEGIPCPWAGSGGCLNYEPKEKVSK